jgi:ATP-dependent DNA helicase RecQ
MSHRDPHQVLKSHWGFDAFRPLQEDIVRSALAGNDTLALMPTGGGKSICFQVPALCLDGLCIVVSPLIALMRDQVENLLKKGIKAVYLHAGMKQRELDILLDNCIYGGIKFLYVSPERLQSELFQARLPDMNICLFAIDESHCISQWGYDFRPPYLKIADVVDLLPKRPPMLAVTATATPKVADDIMSKLRFQNGKRFQMSFKRDNLGYVVVKTADKHGRLLEILKRIPGSGVVYLRNRKGTAQIAEFLKGHGISADFYHAGLKPDERNLKQERWTNGTTRIIVATNAFGMGIDKPDVRVVVHMDLPDSLEAYFQEAGRGGRDGKTAWAVLLTSDGEASEIVSRNLRDFPEIKDLKRIYQALANFLMIAPGSGEDETYVLDLAAFCKKFQLPVNSTLHGLKILQKQEYFEMDEDFWEPSKLMVRADHQTLYGIQVQNNSLGPLIGTLLRSYGGLQDGFVKIQENDLAKRVSKNPSEVIQMLKKLDEMGIVSYEPSKKGSQITFTSALSDARYLRVDPQFLGDRRKDLEDRLLALKDYVVNQQTCRSVLLVKYFGEKNPENCGKCDFCKRQKKPVTKDLKQQIFGLLKSEPMDIKTLVDRLNPPDRHAAIAYIRELIDKEEITIINQHLLTID